MALSPDTTLAEVIDKITLRGATTYLGLLTADIGPLDTMATMQEYVGAGYARIAVTWTVPAAPTVGDPIVSNNATSATFTFTADATVPIYHVVLLSVQTGTAGTIRRVWPVAAPFMPKAGDTFTINIGDLIQGAA